MISFVLITSDFLFVWFLVCGRSESAVRSDVAPSPHRYAVAVYVHRRDYGRENFAWLLPALRDDKVDRQNHGFTLGTVPYRWTVSSFYEVPLR